MRKVILILILILYLCTELFAEETQKGKLGFSIEYMSTKDYSTVLGANFYLVEANTIGGYTNILASMGKEYKKYDDLDEYSFGDPVTGEFKELLMANIGATRKIIKGIEIYFGLGYAMSSAYFIKYDSYHILSDNGEYAVPNHGKSKTGLNLNPGLLLYYKTIGIEVSYHSFTKSPAIGLGFVF